MIIVYPIKIEVLCATESPSAPALTGDSAEQVFAKHVEDSARNSNFTITFAPADIPSNKMAQTMKGFQTVYR